MSDAKGLRESGAVLRALLTRKADPTEYRGTHGQTFPPTQATGDVK